MDVGHGGLRRQAFARLAALSSRPSPNKDAEFKRLASSIPPAKAQTNGVLEGVLRAISPTSRTPMSLREFDILLALCASAHELHDYDHADRLTSQLIAYLPEAHTQLFAASPFLHEIKPAPWTALTYQLTKALLILGLKFPTLKDGIANGFKAYLINWSQSADALASTGLGEEDEDTEYEAREIAAVTVSLLGFMDAAALHENFWSSYERVEMIRSLKDALSEDFLIAVETASSAIRTSVSSEQATRDWRRYLKRFAAQGIPVGAMMLQKGFMKLVLSCTARMLCDEHTVQCGDILDQYIAGSHLHGAKDEHVTDDMVEYLVQVVTDQINILEDGSDYLQLSSAWQQRLAFSVKAYALEAFLHCLVLDDDIADPEDLFGWLEDSIANQVQMADIELADIALKSLAVVAKFIPESASNYARILLRFIVQGTSQPQAVTMASQSLSHILRMLSQDAVITTIYSLGNVLSSQTSAEKSNQPILFPDADGNLASISAVARLRTGSVISLSISGDEETSLVCGNVVHAIVVIATECNDSKITALVQMMMLQKIGRVSLVVDARIAEEAAKLAIHGKENEFRALLRLYTRLHQEAIAQENRAIFDSVRNAQEYLAMHLDSRSPLFKIYATHLLERIVSKGDIVEGEFKQSAEVEQAAKEIAPLLKPLSILASRKPPLTQDKGEDNEVLTLAREVWYNIAVHGITLQSRIGQQFYHELRILAMNSLPLVDEARAELLESDVELNTVLRRGMSPQHTADQKKNLIAIIPEKESDIRQMSYQKVVFLNAVFLVESLRATSGSCAEILDYFADPTTQTSHMGSCLGVVAFEVVKRYTEKVIAAQEEEFSAPYASRQLAQILSMCCHRSSKMQEVARLAANHIIALAPSALCQKAALFALLELLSLMWSSCLEADLDEYEWRSTLTSTRGKITIELSDDYAYRQRTLNNLNNDARRWVASIMAIAPLDVKGLLQTYLSEFDDTGAYGHVSLGRSFALEMGSMIPPSDQRLNALDRKADSVNINMGSDFMAQYTTRQEYRFTGIPEHQRGKLQLDNSTGRRFSFSKASANAPNATTALQDSLADLHHRTGQGTPVQASEVKDVLRWAAAVLCQSKKSQTAIVHHLVSIPFEIFTKESIKLGISLWLGVIHENSRMEPRILTEVVQAWERTIDRKEGIFSPSFNHSDPFYVKEEFAPSDKAAIQKQAQATHNIISPHFRIIQFFESHFNAIRLGSPNTQRTFLRTLERTLTAFSKLNWHPLLRETQFHVVMFALRVYKTSTTTNRLYLWKLRDLILSVGLRWFTYPPTWSFGGNRLQIKAEILVMKEVLSHLESSRQAIFASSVTRKDTQQKQLLLETLLAHEISRLTVWLSPLGHSGIQPRPEAPLNGFARVAWAEDAALALQLLHRSANDQLRQEIRFLLSNFPEKAIHAATGIDLLLGDALPSDVSFQLKYLLYWAPVNPMQAVTYFLPAYGNHPLVLQYGMRALESHSVDVTFFYVPQIVQSLRYDALGYVERYIIEAGKFSQLFAHQIIWNMKANAYKDEDSQEPDPVKPTLDKVMDSLVSSFSGPDKDFYEREFAFFAEVTDISGKLKPFIKKSKPEKKAKIEEELRKIKVEVGVYIPSNPDGTVVGIDRKSGKPLQSHAKAPYMATFRIRKTKDATPEAGVAAGEMVPRTPTVPRKGHSRRNTSDISNIGLIDNDSTTYEIWQSAIFKVGDDCRQDMLALQMIAAFRGIFNSIGLDVYVFPYHVTATAPGCGVIEVLPNSISRDMLGREAVNGLHDYFITKYGGEHSVRYQEARSEFVKSMAAYSVISYLLQFKDRHNGNIMIDDKGHILHIDFGFCFDIAPGGVKFERAPFKLTPEMIAVMGGADATSSQAYRWFEELTIKAFLSSRQYCDKLSHLVGLMLDSGLPCFKPETMRNFRNRFVLEKTNREAADFMLACIKKSAGNVSTKVYDEFQLLTNGIPY